MAASGKAPAEIVSRRGVQQVSDDSLIRKLARRVLDDNPDKVRTYRDGKKGLLGFFVGQVMQLSGGKANPKLTNRVIMEMLEDD